MALDMRDNSTIGCAFFSTETGMLSISDDMQMASLDVAEQFIIHTQPTTVLVCGRAAESLVDFLEKKAGVDNEGTHCASRGTAKHLTISQGKGFRLALFCELCLQLTSPIKLPKKGSPTCKLTSRTMFRLFSQRPMVIIRQST